MNTHFKLPVFIKYNIAALIATAVDFFVLIFLTEALGMWYLISAFLGALSGAIVSFVLERRWAFNKTNGKISKQATRYILTLICSVLLNTVGLYLVVELSNIPYAYAKILVATSIGVSFNYFMHKYYIFK